MKTQASLMFHNECSKLPQHSMHVHARMMTTMYLVKRYGKLVQAHKRMLSLALANLDNTKVTL